MSAHYRWSVASRVVAALAGGYVLTALASTALALALPHMPGTSRAGAVLIATLLSFAIHTGAALWVFCARSAWRAWLGLSGSALACALLGLALRSVG